MRLINTDPYDMALAALFLLLLILGVTLAARRLRRRKDNPLYVAREVLFSPRETGLLDLLGEALGDGYRVLGKVPLTALVAPRPGLGKSRGQKALERLEGRTADLVICRRKDLAVMGVVELERQGEPNPVLLEALEDAAIPVVRLSPREDYSPRDLKRLLSKQLGWGAKQDEWQLGSISPPLPDPVEEWRLGDAGPEVRPVEGPEKGERPPPPGAQETGPCCPSCGAEMVRRRVVRGEKAGMVFWGCGKYPECRKIIPIGRKED